MNKIPLKTINPKRRRHIRINSLDVESFKSIIKTIIIEYNDNSEMIESLKEIYLIDSAINYIEFALVLNRIVDIDVIIKKASDENIIIEPSYSYRDKFKINSISLYEFAMSTGA